VTVERIPELAARAEALLRELGYDNVSVHVAGSELGRPEDGPYDAIACAAAAPRVPDSLVDQLALGGRLVLPVGEHRDQDLVLVEKTAEGVKVSHQGPCRFVPLIGKGAFSLNERAS